MQSGIDKILLPLSVDGNFENSARLAFHIANLSGGVPTILTIDDDSPRYETTALPFHTKDLNPGTVESDISAIPVNNEMMKVVDSLSKEYKCAFRKQIVRGHAATQILLVSRYHDVVIMSDRALFADSLGEGQRRVSPICEILDQAVIPTVLCGEQSDPVLGSAAIYFDGSPFAALALHQTACLYQHSPDAKIVVRVSHREEAIASQLAADALNYLKNKGLDQSCSEISDDSPITLAQGHSGDEVGLVALGIRSRLAFHDFRIGALAHHFLKNEPRKNKLFC